MNSDEPLVNLDFTETNQENLIKISNSNNKISNNQFPNINHCNNNTNNQRPLSLVSSQSSSLSSSPSLHTSLSQKTAALCSTDNKTVTSQQQQQPLDDLDFIDEHSVNVTNLHSNNSDKFRNHIDFDVNVNDIHKTRKHFLLDDQNSLISLTSNSSDAEPEAINISEVIEGGESGGCGGSVSVTHPDDIVEVSLLPETSMDSRESQPLLGNCSRDTHDMAYNNFTGKLISIVKHLVFLTLKNLFEIEDVYTERE